MVDGDVFVELGEEFAVAAVDSERVLGADAREDGAAEADFFAIDDDDERVRDSVEGGVVAEGTALRSRRLSLIALRSELRRAVAATLSPREPWSGAIITAVPAAMMSQIQLHQGIPC